MKHTITIITALFICLANLAVAQETPGVYNLYNKCCSRTVEDKINETIKQWFGRNVLSTIIKAKDGGYVSSFLQDSIQISVAFNEKGKWHHTIRSANSSLLPVGLMHEVKNKYQQYSINAVKEVIFKDDKLYLVYISGESTAKLLRIASSGIEEIQHLNNKPAM